MSKTIDQRVVEMRFDNAHFEKNVSTTMSTLDKLKSKLNFSNSVKGLDEVNNAASRVNMSGLAAGIETVQARFTALQIAGITALSRLTNAAITAGKNIVNSLTIQPVTTGFNEYELKMGSVQTIMASTGESLETVNKYLEELNAYSDQTIYSFSDMTQNIGKFTNAGVKLEDAVAAIKGISNEAALSGANANEASRAMYNFAQALSSGYVKLIDWKSIENANMATVGFKEELINAAVELGTLTKTTGGFKTAEGTVITATKNFNDSLQDQWMTSDVLVKTLHKYSDETTEIGKKATQAATEVKTFTQMLDTLKESAQSGWAQSWEIIFGDFEEGKTLWTGISEAIGGILDATSKSRNEWLSENLTNDSKWEQFNEQLKEAGISTEVFEENLIAVAKENGIAVDKLIEEYGTFKKVISASKIPIELFSKTLKQIGGATDGVTTSTSDLNEKLEYFQKVVEKVWHGDFKNGTERMEALTKAGYDYAVVQELVNKTEDGHKLTLEDLSDAQLENIGYTKEQIKKINELAEQAKKAGTPLNDLIESLTKPTGRDLLIDSFKNIWEYFKRYADLISEAWNNVFNDGNEASEKFTLYDAIEEFKELTDQMTVSEETAEKFKTAMEGLFAGFKLTGSIAGRSVVAFLKIFEAFLGLFDVQEVDEATGEIVTRSANLLDAAAFIGEKIKQLYDWFDGLAFVGWDTAYGDIAAGLKAVYDGVIGCIEAFVKIPVISEALSEIGHTLAFIFKSIGIEISSLDIQGVTKAISFFFGTIEKWITDLGNNAVFIDTVLDIVDTITLAMKSIYFGISNAIDGIFEFFYYLILGIKKIFMGDDFVVPGENIVDGLVKGLTKGIKNIWKVVTTLADAVIDTFCAILGIESPSKVFIALGGFIVLGLIKGIEGESGWVVDAVTALGNQIATVFEKLIQNGIPYVTDLVSTLGQNILTTIKNTGSVDFGSIFIFGSTIGFGLLIKKFIDVLDKFATPIKSLSKIMNEVSEMIDAVGDSINKYAKAKSWEAYSKSLLNVAMAIGILAVSLIALTNYVKMENLWQCVGAIGALSAILFVLSVALEKINSASASWEKGKGLKFEGIKTGMISIAIALLAMAAVVKLLGSMDLGEAIQGGIGLIVLCGLLMGVLAVYGELVKGKAAQNIKKAGSMMRSLAVTLLLMVAVVKLIGMLTPDEINQGTNAIFGFLGLTLMLMGIAAIPSKNVKNIGKMMLQLSASLLLMVAVVKLIGGLTQDEINQGTKVIAGFAAMMAILAFITMIPVFNTDRITKTMLAFSASMLLLSLTGKILASMTWPDIGTAVGGLIGLTVVVGLLVTIINHIAKDAPKIVGTLLGLSVSLLILSGVAILLGAIPSEKIWNGVKVVGALSIFMALMIYALKGANDIKGSLIVLTVAIAILTVCVAALAQLTPEQLWGPTIALGLLMGMFALLTYSSKFATGSMATLIIMTVVVGLLGVILYTLGQLPVDNVLGSAIGLSTLLLAMSAALLILAAVGTFIAPVYAGLIALGILVVAIGAVLIAIGALEEPLTKGIEVLEKLGTGFGKAIGNFIGGIAEGITDSMPVVAENLSNFMTKLDPFIQGMSGIKEDFKTGMQNFSDGLGSISLVSLAKLDNIGARLKDFSDYAVNIDSNAITNSVSLTESIVKAVNNLGSIDSDAIAKFKSVISDLCESNLEELVSVFSGASDIYTNIGDIIVKSIANTLTADDSSRLFYKAAMDWLLKIRECISERTEVSIATKRFVENIITIIKGYYGHFFEAGKNMVTGFASGISANTYEAYAKAKVMAQMAEKGAKEELDINSPSKVGYSIGDFFGLGFVNAILDYAEQAYNASVDMASSAKGGLSDAIAKIRDVIENDIDAQPTIRPVLDLSNVKSGANALSSLFGSNQTIGALASVGSINTMMNQRQNGTNNDVVSAINKLNNKLDKVGNTSYNINGITYDDGSNISDAIKTLVRAVTIEGRT